jgi:hypothetical protein
LRDGWMDGWMDETNERAPRGKSLTALCQVSTQCLKMNHNRLRGIIS